MQVHILARSVELSANPGSNVHFFPTNGQLTSFFDTMANEIDTGDNEHAGDDGMSDHQCRKLGRPYLRSVGLKHIASLKSTSLTYRSKSAAS